MSAVVCTASFPTKNHHGSNPFRPCPSGFNVWRKRSCSRWTTVESFYRKRAASTRGSPTGSLLFGLSKATSDARRNAAPHKLLDGHCVKERRVFQKHPRPSSLFQRALLERSRVLMAQLSLAAAFVVLSALTPVLIQPFLASQVFAVSSSSSSSASSATGGAVQSVGTVLLQSVLLNSACTGFFTGCLHTLSGPDHLAALAPLVIGRSRAESAGVGALWGCGHDAGQMIFGLLFLVLKDRFRVEIFRTWGARVVGCTLLVIGLMGMKEATDLHNPMKGDGESSAKKKKTGLTVLATGIVHGLQPDSLMMILPALALPSRLASAVFLVTFLVGTVVSMGGYAAFVGSCAEVVRGRVPKLAEKLTWVSSLVAFTLGSAILMSQYLGFTLF